MNPRLVGLTLSLVLYACVHSVKAPTFVVTQDATIAVVDAGSLVDASDPTDATASGDSKSVDASPAEASVAVVEKVDHTPEFVEYIHSAMKEWVHLKCSNDGKDCQCFWNPDPNKVEACIQNYDKFYQEIATTIVEVVSDPSIVLPIIGDNHLVKSALLMTSIAAREGGYHKEVDSCKRTGDNGRALGLWQTWSSPYGVCKDRKLALRFAIKVVNQSFDACKSLPLQLKLTAYASGNCTNEQGRANSRSKVNKAMDYLKAHPFTFEP